MVKCDESAWVDFHLMEKERTVVACDEGSAFARSPAVEAGFGRQWNEPLGIQFMLEQGPASVAISIFAIGSLR